ncbi:NTP transferase domain-containing protein [Arcticibacter sp. MXS-1]|uniref:nucleotidyltransferase family protein n=1 Tax=Arcticibacter sp. MXS-1 TaxID=3341726 RepID=UPI0035A8F4BC
MIGFIILAAGASARLGRAKQNLLYKGKTLLEHAADSALDAGAQLVVVVTGANADSLASMDNRPGVVLVHNENWEKGMGESIKTGVRYLVERAKALEAILVMLCDQPFVDANVLKKIQNQYQKTGKGIVASSFGGVMSAPALFDRKYFANLLELSGAEGAKKLFSQYKADLNSVESIESKMDIDTEQDYLALISGESVEKDVR